MKSVTKSLTCAALLCLSGQVAAQTLVTLVSFTNPYPSSGPGTSLYVIDAKTATPFTCGATSTTSIRFKSGFEAGWDHADDNYEGAGNASFIMLAEVISAAKNGYPIELATLIYNSDFLTCDVTKYFIHVL